MKKIINFIIFTCLFGLFIGCDNLVNKPVQKGQATISISGVSCNSKEAFSPEDINENDITKAELIIENIDNPDSPEITETLSFLPVTENQVIETETGTATVVQIKESAISVLRSQLLSLDEGTYNFYLNLYVLDLDSQERRTQSDKIENLTLEAGKTYPLAFSTKYVDKGDLCITYKWITDGEDNRIGSVKMGLISFPDGEEIKDSEGNPLYPLEECEITFDAENSIGSATYRKNDIKNNNYFLIIQLYDNPQNEYTEPELVNTYQDFVSIYGYKTVNERTLSLDEYNQNYYIYYDLHGGEFKEGYEAPKSFSPNNITCQLPVSIKFNQKKFGESSTNWYFAGWFEKDENGNETKIEAIELGTARDVTLHAKWGLTCNYGTALEAVADDGSYDYENLESVNIIFDDIITEDDFDEYASQIAAEHKYKTDNIPEGFSEVENGAVWSQKGLLSVYQKYDRIEVTNTYICNADDDNAQTITKTGKYGTPTGFSNSDIPSYEGYRFRTWTDEGGDEIDEVPEAFGSYDRTFNAVYDDLHSELSGNIVVNDGLVDIGFESPSVLYLNDAYVGFTATSKLDPEIDLSKSEDVVWDAHLFYGGVDINNYGTEYYKLEDCSDQSAPYAKVLKLKHRLEISDVYQLYVSATYNGVTSTSIVELTIANNEYYSHSITESNFVSTLTSEMKNLIAPAIVVLEGTIPSDNTSLYTDICSALNQASCRINVDMSQVSGITSIGTGSDYDFTSNNIKSLILPLSVETIGEKAFNSSGLKEITIPASVTEIDTKAFNKCNSLNQFIISGQEEEQTPVYSTVKDGVMLIHNVFDDLGALESCILLAGAKDAVPANLDFSDSDLSVITEIGPNAFYGNSRLVSIESFGNVTTIGDSAFYECSNLTSIPEIKDPITSIGYMAFYSCYDLQTFSLYSDSITIGNAEGGNDYSSVNAKELIFNFDIICYANQDAGITANYDKVKNTIVSRIQGVESVVFKGKVQLPDLECSTPPSSAPSDSFLYEYRYRLKSLTFDDQNNDALSIIGDYQFNHYTDLETVTNNGKLGRIGDRAFADTGISQIYLDGIISVGENAFGDCSNLTDFFIDENSGSHYSVVMNNKALIYTTGDGGSSVNRLERCLPASGITTLDFSSSELSGITQIGAYAFDGCTALTEITDWGGIEEIHDYAFNGCTELASIPALGDSSTESEMTLSENVFKGCSKLNEITIGGTNVTLNDTFKQSSTYSVIFDFAINSTNINDVRNKIIAGLYPYISKVTFDKTVNLPDVTYFEDESLFDDSGDMIAPPSSTQMKQSDALFARFVDTYTFGTVIFNGKGSTIGAYQFCGFKNKLGQTTGAEYVNLNGNVTTIGKYAFYNCQKLDAIDLTGVEVIYDYAFANTGLGGKTVTIPASVYAIGNCAFMNESQVDFIFENPITIEEEADSFWSNFYRFNSYNAWQTFVNEKSDSITTSTNIILIWDSIPEGSKDQTHVVDYIKEVIAPTSVPPSSGYIISYESTSLKD